MVVVKMLEVTVLACTHALGGEPRQSSRDGPGDALDARAPLKLPDCRVGDLTAAALDCPPHPRRRTPRCD